MSLVLDSSVTLAWLYSDELTPATQQVLDRVTTAGAWVPSLWRLEVANSLQGGVRRGRISAEFRDAALTDLAGSLSTMPRIWNWPGASICLWPRSIRNCAPPGARSASLCWEADV